jgi:RepB DNA-primase from phage plasmid
MPPPKVAEIVTYQTNAMHSDKFEIGLLRISPDRRGVMRIWDQATLLKSVAWLKRENVKGMNINIRPVGNHLTLLDDLSAETISTMGDQGFGPCVILETSPRNFQVWLDHGYQLALEDATHAAQYLARRFGSDYGAAGRRHFSRLAGFTNRKEKHQKADGLFPFVRLEYAQEGQYAAAKDFPGLLNEYKKSIAPRPHYREGLPNWNNGTNKSVDEFRNDRRRYPTLHNAALAYAVYAISRGLNHQLIRDAIASRDLSHKGNRRSQLAYVERTLRKAIRAAT